MNRRDLLALIKKPGSAYLDGWSDAGRWTIALPDPIDEFRVEWGEEARLDSFLRGRSGERGPSPADPGIPFSGGWIGFIGYEVGALWEGAAARVERPPEPAALFYRHEEGVAIDPGGNSVSLQEFRAGARAAGSREKRDHRQTAPAFDRAPTIRGVVEDSLGEVEYRLTHEAIREGIARGDYYQVNLTRRFRVAMESREDPRGLFSNLAGEQPPPYSMLLRGRDFDILSASPELFLRADFVSRRVEMRPIKGTAPRHGDPQADRESAQRLFRSEKDRAENVMIVDLCRNDLGRVCETGSVRVADLCRVRSHRVHHLESTVFGLLRPEITPLDVLRATFPPGSVTGAPKRAAVAAIRALEPVARGVYTGIAGFFDRRGRMEFNVAIRTAVSSPEELRYHAGGGIVWDSEAGAERLEADLKAREFFSLVAGDGGESAR